MSSQKELRDERLREEYMKALEEDEEIKNKIIQEKRVDRARERKDFVRRLEQERREAALNGVVLKAQEVAKLQQNQFEQEEKLAAEMDLIRRKEIVELKLRQHLRENSHELMALESQLRAAYTKKALASQLAEKEANKLEDQIREKRAREVLIKAIGTLEEQEEADMRNRNMQKEKFRHLLQNQIIEKESMRQQEFIALLKEKKLSEDIIQAIKDEEVRELETKRNMQIKIKEEMEQFYKAREMWKAKERFVIQEEEERRRKINDEKAKMVAEDNSLKKLKQETFDKMIQKMVQESEEKMRKKQEREELMSTLMIVTKEEEEKEKARREMEKEIAMRKEARIAFQKILAAKAEKEREEKELELEFRRMMTQKKEEEDRKEAEKQRQRREALINTRKYNEEAMKQNVRKRAQELKLNQLIDDLEVQEEKRKEKLIEEERIRILRQHAPRLLGYFPKGCLSEKDLEILGLSGNSPLPDSCPLEK